MSEKFDRNKVAKRLIALRKLRNLSQAKLAKQLQNLIGYNKEENPYGIKFEGDNGKQTISQLERGTRGITIDMAFGYAEIFGVSLDYILGYTDDWKPQYESVKNITGLDDRSIEVLNELLEFDENLGINSIILNCLFDTGYIAKCVKLVHADMIFSLINKTIQNTNKDLFSSFETYSEFSKWKFNIGTTILLKDISNKILSTHELVLNNEISNMLSNLNDEEIIKAEHHLKILHEMINEFGAET